VSVPIGGSGVELLDLLPALRSGGWSRHPQPGWPGRL